jgi:hypothetical protein
MEKLMVAKKTFYKDYYFRSKLEAKWAVFFDLMNIPFVYEPESFICEDGSQYTPDFYLPEAILRDGNDVEIPKTQKHFDDVNLVPRDTGTYLEIKPLNYSDEDLYEKRIASAINKPLILLCGDPVDALINGSDSSKNRNFQLSPYWDNCMVFMYCDKCHSYKFEFNEGNYYQCPKCSNPISTDFVEIKEQCIKARNFRFQYYSIENK